MSLPARALIALMLFAGLTHPQRAFSQTPSPRTESNTSVSGKVTINGKPAIGVIVGMHLVRPERNSPTFKSTTDKDGIYRINNLPNGSYQIAPVAPGMLISDPSLSAGQNLVIGEGDSVEGIDFDLVRGGAITGKVTDADGRPLIEEQVSLVPVDPRNQRGVTVSGGSTDDRGIYRLFGVRPGRYKVSVGEYSNLNRSPRQRITQTYSPDATDFSKAATIDVAQGGESSNVDIKVGPMPETFTVTGRVIDADTGNPEPNVSISLSRLVVYDAGNSANYGENVDAHPDKQGQFRLTNIRAGKYQIWASGGPESDLLPQSPSSFEVVNSDVADVVLKTNRGGQVSGVVIFEGPGKETPTDAFVYVTNRDPANPNSGRQGSIRVEPNGRFISSWGLNPGTLIFSIGTSNRYLNLRRVERDGVVQPNGIPVQKGEHITGVRLYVNYASGSVRGIVKVINGKLLPSARLTVQLNRSEPDFFAISTQPDGRGNFVLEGLVPGTYELNLLAYTPDLQTRPPMVKQTVTVTDGGVTEVVLTLDLAAR